jgi:hypothetical protein
VNFVHDFRGSIRRGGLGLSVFLLALPCQQLRAELRFEQTTVQLGPVRGGVRLAQEFTFTNDGPEPVEVLDVRVGCGCLKPTLARRTFPPGEQGAIVLEVNTLGQAAGAHTWHADVRYRRGTAEQEVALELAATLFLEVTVQPAALTLFTEGAFRQELTLTDLRPQALSVTNVGTSSDRLRASRPGPSVDADGHRLYRIQLDVAADCPEGRHEEIVSVYTDDPLYKHLQIPVTVVRRSRPRFAVEPARVEIHAPAGGSPPSPLLQVRDVRGEAVVIQAVTADDPAVQCRWAKGPGNLATVRVQIDRGRLAGPALETNLHVRLAGPVAETLTVPVTCSQETAPGP